METDRIKSAKELIDFLNEHKISLRILDCSGEVSKEKKIVSLFVENDEDNLDSWAEITIGIG